MERPIAPQSWRYFAAVGGSAILYFAVASLIASIPQFGQLSTPICLPMGVSLAILLLFGSALAPGLWLGEFWFAQSQHLPWLAAGGTATGVMLQALIAVTLLRRSHFHPTLVRLRDVAALVLLAAVLSSLVGPLIGLTSLCLSKVYAWSQFWSILGQWWLGNVVAVLLVTPVLLTWLVPSHLSLSQRRHWFEIGLWLLLLFNLSWFVLTVRSQVEIANYPLEYILLPMVIWAALRFGQRGTTLASLVISSIALWGLSQGGSPFLLDSTDLSRATLFLQAFVAVVAVTGLFLAATMAERQQAIVSLNKANAQLQELTQTLDQQVHERTQQLRETETRARRLVESNIISIAFWDAAGNIVEANQCFYELLGYDPAAAEPLNWHEITPLEHQPLDQQAIEEMHQTTSHRPFEKEYIHKDGTRIPVLVGATYLGGTEEIGVSFVLDLTEHKRTQEALRESERRFRRLAESNILGVAFGDFQGRIHYINDYLLKMLDCEREDLLSGRHRWSDMTPPEFLPLDVRGGEELKQYGVCTPYEKEFIRRDGQRVPVLLGATLLQEPYNAQQEIMAFCVDLTQLKQAEAALRQSKAEIAALNLDLERRVNELQTLFEVIPISIAIATDPNCRQVQVNSTFAQILGTALISDPVQSEHASDSLFRVFQGNHELQGKELPLQYAATHGVEVRDVEMDIVRNDGVVFNLFGYAAPLLDEQGRSRGAVSAFLDITERKRAEAERLQLLMLEQVARSEAEAAQRQLATIFETSPVGLGFLDRQQRYVAVNEALAEIDGLSPEQHLGYSIADLFSESDPALVELFDRLYATGNPFIAPNFAVNVPGRDDRKPGYYNVYYLPNITPQGEVESVLVYVLDVTDRVHLEQRELFLANASMVLAASLDYEATLKQLADLAVSGLADWCAVDTLEEDGKIRRIAIAHTDPSKVEWGWELERRYPVDRPDRKQGVPQVIQTGQAEIYTEISDESLAVVAQDAEHLQLLRQIGFSSVMVLPLIAGGQTLGAISLIAAESGRRYGLADLLLAEELARRAAQSVYNARLYRQAQELNRIKDEFLATLSHELRSPLNGILGWAQMLRRGKLNPSTTERALETIERNARAQVQLIDDLLDISRIIRGKLRLEVRPIELGSVIEAAIDAMRPAANAKDIGLRRVLDPNIGLVSGDPERLQQILWNLISNAIKFTPNGGLVEVRLQRHQSHIEVIVNDTGKGISPNFLPYVFERFRQADSSITRTYGGLGLGLAIVRHLTELHGGTVQVASPGEGQGSTFTVRLPLLSAQSESAPPSSSLLLEEMPLDNTPRLDELRILVVDDEADARELVTTVLQESGATVKAVASVIAALTALETFQPDVLVSDIGMPGEDGYSLMRQVRSRDAAQGGQVPAVALTAYARDDDRRRALLAGFQTHVSKPVNPTDLVVVVASLAGRVANP